MTIQPKQHKTEMKKWVAYKKKNMFKLPLWKSVILIFPFSLYEDIHIPNVSFCRISDTEATILNSEDLKVPILFPLNLVKYYVESKWF